MGDLNEKKLIYFPSLWIDRALVGEWRDALSKADEKAKSQPLVALPNYSEDSIYQLLSKIDTTKPDAVAQLNAIRLLELGYAECLKNTEAFVRSLIKANVTPKRGGGVQKPADEPFGEVENKKQERKRRLSSVDDDDSNGTPPKKAANEIHYCDHPGCTREFATSASLAVHKRVHK